MKNILFLLFLLPSIANAQFTKIPSVNSPVQCLGGIKQSTSIGVGTSHLYNSFNVRLHPTDSSAIVWMGDSSLANGMGVSEGQLNLVGGIVPMDLDPSNDRIMEIANGGGLVHYMEYGYQKVTVANDRYTVLNTDEVILVASNTNHDTIFLNAANTYFNGVTNRGLKFFIKRTDTISANRLIVKAPALNSIDGVIYLSIGVLNSYELQAYDDNKFYIIAKF